MLLHALIPASRANGPGLRTVLFFQGCSIHVQSCWNPKSHQFHGEKSRLMPLLRKCWGHARNIHWKACHLFRWRAHAAGG
jgi:pyruvate-formate lyase-activating enzyme